MIRVQGVYIAKNKDGSKRANAVESLVIAPSAPNRATETARQASMMHEVNAKRIDKSIEQRNDRRAKRKTK